MKQMSWKSIQSHKFYFWIFSNILLLFMHKIRYVLYMDHMCIFKYLQFVHKRNMDTLICPPSHKGFESAKKCNLRKPHCLPQRLKSNQPFLFYFLNQTRFNHIQILLQSGLIWCFFAYLAVAGSGNTWV